MRRPWKELIAEIVDMMPRSFELRDVLRFEQRLSKEYPENIHIGAKIRQTLQVLRDRGVIAFEGKGKYMKLEPEPRFSPLIDFTLASGLTSRAQIARMVLETWAEFNLFCLNCDSDALARLAANTPIADFECRTCASRYQLKGKDGRFGAIITGAAYQPTIDAIRSGTCPNYILVEYDRRFGTVVFGRALPGSLICESRLIKRSPLKATAARAGWVGCNLRIEGLPTVAVVQPAVVNPALARAGWSKLR